MAGFESIQQCTLFKPFKNKEVAIGRGVQKNISQRAFTRSKLTIETLQQGVKYVSS